MKKRTLGQRADTAATRYVGRYNGSTSASWWSYRDGWLNGHRAGARVTSKRALGDAYNLGWNDALNAMEQSEEVPNEDWIDPIAEASSKAAATMADEWQPWPAPAGICASSKAPEGWWCSRVHDHEGPCAAYPLGTLAEMPKSANVTLAEMPIGANNAYMAQSSEPIICLTEVYSEVPEQKVRIGGKQSWWAKLWFKIKALFVPFFS